MKTILFIDQCTPYSYDASTINNPQGGTETAVTKIAEGIKATGLFNVSVEQHTRRESYAFTSPTGVHYTGVGDTIEADFVVCLRVPESLTQARRRFPNAKLYLWMHDLANPSYGKALAEIREAGTDSILCVSQFHKDQTIDHLKPFGYSESTDKIKVLYNSIADDLKPDNTPVDLNKLCFISSPHKGLEYTLQVFQTLLSVNPNFTLHVSNPGYLPDWSKEQKNVIIMGRIPHSEVIKQLRSSLCVFYPNTVFPETFGMVFVEANAVGTPVITHPLGAASEVLYHPYETVDCRNPNNVIERVLSWYGGERPRVKGQDKFRFTSVIKSWIRTLT